VKIRLTAISLQEERNEERRKDKIKTRIINTKKTRKDEKEQDKKRRPDN
jgi:hypothetical protein